MENTTSSNHITIWKINPISTAKDLYKKSKSNLSFTKYCIREARKIAIGAVAYKLSSTGEEVTDIEIEAFSSKNLKDKKTTLLLMEYFLENTSKEDAMGAILEYEAYNKCFVDYNTIQFTADSVSFKLKESNVDNFSKQ